jgi:predicted  nucleic acid-binding Zn-ribbon protein
MAAEFSVYNRVMSAALGLLRLQQVDSRMGRKEARLQQIQETLDNDSELAAARERLKSARAARHASEQARRSAESEAEAQQTKIKQAESRLYGGTVRKPKELQELQADVASLKKHLATIEEQELEAMLSVDSAQAALETAEAQLNQVQTRLSNEYKKLIDERAILSRDQENLQAERQAALSTVAAEILKTYEGLRLLRGGLAVAEISDNACGACGTTLTAALQQSARHAAQLVYCPSCGRVLYAG